MSNALKPKEYDPNPLQKLMNAEKLAAETIAREEKLRAARLAEAQDRAEKTIKERHDAEELKFENERKETEGEGDEKLRQLLQATEVEKKQQAESFAKGKDNVVQLLLHHVTTCSIGLNESQRQAFLAMQRKEAEKNTKTAEE